MNINDFKYVSSGKFITVEKWIHPDRCIDTHEIIFMTEGTAYIRENQEKYILKQGDILYLEPGKNHKGYNYNKKGDKRNSVVGNGISVYLRFPRSAFRYKAENRNRCSSDIGIKYL